jgi:hypothetical protein
MVVNSLITSHKDGAREKVGRVAVGGIAWDGGYGIRSSRKAAAPSQDSAVSADTGRGGKEAARQRRQRAERFPALTPLRIS